MAQSAAVVQYRTQFIEGFEQGQSLLRTAVTTESVIKGNTATFLVTSTNGATAVTRGLSGLIPARYNDKSQLSATLVEWHDLVQETNFNIFQSQGDGARIMQANSRKVLNRKIDSDILAELANATQDTGSTGVTASLDLVMYARTILGNADVDITEADNMFAVVTPAFMAYLMQTPEFASNDYVDVKPFAGPARRMLRWAGFNWIEHPNLTGAATASESTYFFHRSAIGHAVNTGDMEVAIGYNEEQAYSYARSSIFMGSKILQNTGIVKVIHDGSGYAAQ